MTIYGDGIDGVWNASHALSIVGPGLPGVEKREKSTAFSRSEVIVHRKQARRQTDLDCPLTIVMIEDRCSSILQSPRKTREKDKREAMALEKLASLSLLHLHEYLPHPLIFENVLIMSQCPRIPEYFCTCADSVYQALLFPPLREARASFYARKIGTGD